MVCVDRSSVCSVFGSGCDAGADWSPDVATDRSFWLEFDWTETRRSPTCTAFERAPTAGGRDCRRREAVFSATVERGGPLDRAAQWRSARRRRPLQPASAAELRWRNGRRLFDAPLQHGRFDHAADGLPVKRPGRFDPHGEGHADKAPKLGETAAMTGHVNQHEGGPQGLVGPPVGGPRRVVMEGRLGRAFFAGMPMAANVRSGFLLFLGRRDDEIGRSHAMRGPRPLFPDWYGSSSCASIRLPTSSRTGCPYRERAASDPWGRARQRERRRSRPGTRRSAGWKRVASRLVPRLGGAARSLQPLRLSGARDARPANVNHADGRPPRNFDGSKIEREAPRSIHRRRKLTIRPHLANQPPRTRAWYTLWTKARLSHWLRSRRSSAWSPSDLQGVANRSNSRFGRRTS